MMLKRLLWLVVGAALLGGAWYVVDDDHSRDALELVAVFVVLYILSTP